MIHISQNLINQAVSYCKSKYPHEACGVWLGEMEDTNLHIRAFTPVTNRSTDPMHHFLMDPTEWVDIIYSTQINKQLQLAGVVHSHPQTAAVPSSEDLQTEWKDIHSYWIISLLNFCSPNIAAYRLDQTKYYRLPVTYL